MVLRGVAWCSAWCCVVLRSAAWGAAWSAAWRCMVPHGCYMMLRGWDDGMIGWWMMDDG